MFPFSPLLRKGQRTGEIKRMDKAKNIIKYHFIARACQSKLLEDQKSIIKEISVIKGREELL